MSRQALTIVMVVCDRCSFRMPLGAAGWSYLDSGDFCPACSASSRRDQPLSETYEQYLQRKGRVIP